MKQFKRQITATAGAILIALGLIGINADRVIAQGNARKEAKVSSILSPRDAASGLPTGIRVNQTSRGRNAKGPKLEKTYNSSAKLKSNARLRSAGNGLLVDENISFYPVKSNARLRSAGNGKTYENVSDGYIAARAKRRRTRIGNGGAQWDIRRPKE